MKAADVAALSSDYEGTPVFIAECMAADTPLVATAVGGIPASSMMAGQGSSYRLAIQSLSRER